MTISGGQLRRYFCLLALALAAGCHRDEPVAVAPPAPAAPPPQNDFHYFVFFNPPHQKQKKVDASGKGATAAEGKNALIHDFLVKTYAETGGEPAMIVEAPECLVELDRAKEKVDASSAGPLKLRTGDGRLAIEGVGFHWQQQDTNSALVISNQVLTTVNADFLSDSNRPAGASGTNQFVRIHSDGLVYDQNSLLINFTGNVRAEDDQMLLSCKTMQIRRTADGALSGIVADDHVAILYKTNGDRFTGTHAVYTAEAGSQLVSLTGEPRWEGSNGGATAKTFVFDRTRHSFRAEEEAHLRLARDAFASFSETGLSLVPQPGAATTGGTNAGFVDITSRRMFFQLPPTNGPVQSVLAEDNVVIMDTNSDSRATGGRAAYAKATGLLELAGNAVWEADGGNRVARGGLLAFDANKKTLAVRTNAYLRLPVTALQESAASDTRVLRNLAGATNHFIEATAGAYDYGASGAFFRDHVLAKLLEDGAIRGTLTGGTVSVEMATVGGRSNVVQNILAETDVHLRQLPVPDPQGKSVAEGLDCRRLQVRMGTNGLVKTITAEGSVAAVRTETFAGGQPPVTTKLDAGAFTAVFQSATNEIESFVAERNVVLRRDDMLGEGAKVAYTASNDTTVLTGDPRLTRPGGTATARDAIIYDRAHGSLILRNQPRANLELQVKPGLLNRTNLPVTTNKAAR